MIVTTTERTTRAVRSRRLLATALIGLGLGACQAAPLPLDADRLSRDDCLRDVKVEALDRALQACDQIVDQFPEDPRPLSDRFVLHSLNEDHRAACRDIEQAATLLRGGPASPSGEADPDPQLGVDIRVRQESCRDLAPLPSPAP